MDLLLALDPLLPSGRALETALRDAIRTGRLQQGQLLPSSRALAADLGVARGTVVSVYEQLVAEGWLTARQGAGTTVARIAASPARDQEPPAPRAATRWRPLRPGTPDLSTFPRQQWSRAIHRAVTTVPATELGYGDAGGPVDARAELVQYLRRTRGVIADADDVLFTTGVAQALTLVARVLAARGRRVVALEDPGSLPVREPLAAAGLRMLPAPVDDRGLIVDELPDDADACLVTPAHQFPLGVAMAPQRRAMLIDWATDRRLILEDDYDAEFRYDRRPISALQPLNTAAVAHMGSVSKTLAPALRIGWLVTPPSLRDEVLAAKRHDDVASTTLNALAFAELIRSGAYDRHLRAQRRHYRRRHARVAEIFTDRGWHVPGIAAGLHLVAIEPDPGAAERASHRADELGLGVPTVSSYRAVPRPSDGPDGLVIGFAAVNAGEERDVLTRLDAALAAGGH
jgi:GntR family transcriptional regulator/MocR family aminotransferase